MNNSFELAHLVPLLQGTIWTLALCVISGIVGTVIGLLLGIGQVSHSRFLRYPSIGYVTLIRGIPVLLLIFFVYFGIPLVFNIDLDAFFTGVLALTVVAAAYTGEIFRGSIEAVNRGQSEASDALGLSYLQKLRFVVLPQAFKIALPSGVGFIISLVKDSSLIGIIGFVELTRASRIVSNLTTQPLVTYSVAALIYFVICFGVSRLGNVLEKKVDAGSQKKLQDFAVANGR